MSDTPNERSGETTPSSAGELKADLVLEGGGVKGIGLVGALSVLEEHGYSFARVAGTSAGAIVGALVAAGMSAARMHDVMKGLRYPSFRDETTLDRVPFFGKGLSVFFELGIYKGDYVHSWLAEQIKSLNVETFADLHEDDPGSSLPPDQRYKLVVMTSDVSGGRLLRLPWDYERFHRDPGTQRVADAVRASISIPFFYRPVRLRDLHSGATSTLVDGGMLSNFPVDTFDRTDGKPPRWPTIGIKLSARPDANQVPRQVTNDWQLIECMLGTMMNFHDQMYLDKPEVQRRTIFVDTMKVSATDFSIDPQTQDQLYENGRAAAEKFLAQRRPGAQ